MFVAWFVQQQTILGLVNHGEEEGEQKKPANGNSKSHHQKIRGDGGGVDGMRRFAPPETASLPESWRPANSCANDDSEKKNKGRVVVVVELSWDLFMVSNHQNECSLNHEKYQSESRTVLPYTIQKHGKIQ